MNDMGDFAKGFKTMSVEELFYRGDGDGDKNNIEGKYDKDGNPIGDTNKEPADGGAAEGSQVRCGRVLRRLHAGGDRFAGRKDGGLPY